MEILLNLCPGKLWFKSEEQGQNTTNNLSLKYLMWK